MNKFEAKWQDDFIERAEECIGSGHSLEAFAGTVGVCRDTIYAWKEIKPGFAEAVARGECKRRHLVEEMLFETHRDKNKNTAIAIFLAKNWAGMADRTEITGPDGRPLMGEVDPEQMSRFVKRHGKDKTNRS